MHNERAEINCEGVHHDCQGAQAGQQHVDGGAQLQVPSLRCAAAAQCGAGCGAAVAIASRQLMLPAAILGPGRPHSVLRGLPVFSVQAGVAGRPIVD